jgi:hypothetical protein
MRKTQIQLPDSLYSRVKRFANEQEMSLAEVTRRSLEQFLDRYPGAGRGAAKWSLPVVDAGGPINISAKKLKEILHQEEAFRSLPHK